MLIKDGVTDSIKVGVSYSMPILMKDLGYCNSWYAPHIWDGEKFVKKFEDKIPDVVRHCNELGHKLAESNQDQTQHGYDTVTLCEVCGYCYHTDSSD